MPSTSLHVHAIPNAPSDTIVGWHGEALKVKVQAVPEKGRANKTLCRHMAGALGIPRSAVSIRSGEKSRSKVLKIDGLTNEALMEKLANLVKHAGNR